jgi:hypothetical protein
MAGIVSSCMCAPVIVPTDEQICYTPGVFAMEDRDIIINFACLV